MRPYDIRQYQFGEHDCQGDRLGVHNLSARSDCIGAMDMPMRTLCVVAIAIVFMFTAIACLGGIAGMVNP